MVLWCMEIVIIATLTPVRAIPLHHDQYAMIRTASPLKDDCVRSVINILESIIFERPLLQSNMKLRLLNC